MSKRELKPGTFAFVPSALAADPDLGRPGLRVGCLMAANADKEGRCWMSYETMARKLRSVRSTVQVGLAQLLSCGHAVKKERPRRTSVYQLIFRHPDELSPAVDREERSGGDRGRRSGSVIEVTAPDGQGVTGFPEEGDCVGRSGVTAPDGRNQYNYERRDRDDEERERARRREASSSTHASGDSRQGEVLREAEEACVVFDEMAERMDWPRAQRLTRKEQRLMIARLEDRGGLGGWREAMAAAERSTYLGKTRPDLKFFLDEDHFAQLMRGRYAPELDPRDRSSLGAALEALAAFGRSDDEGESGASAIWETAKAPSSQSSPPPAAPSPSPPEPSPEPPPQPPSSPPPRPIPPQVDPLAAALAVVKVVSGVPTEQMEAEVSKWRGLLAAAGCDEAVTVAILTDVAQRVPGTRHALSFMQKRIERAIAARGGTS